VEAYKRASKPGIDFLSHYELDAIHNASLEVLENTGIRVTNEGVLDILKKAGAGVALPKMLQPQQYLMGSRLYATPKTSSN